MAKRENITSFHTPDKDGQITLKREVRHYMPKNAEYIILFQKTIEVLLTYDLSKTDLKVFMFLLSQVGMGNELIMPTLQKICAIRTNTHQPHVSKSLKKLFEMNVIVKEEIMYSKSFRYKINYELAAKDLGINIKSNYEQDKINFPIIVNPNQLTLDL